MTMFDDSKVSYELHVEFDGTPIVGNAMCSGDDDYDVLVEDEIIERCNGGDVWAWALVRVTARYDGVDNIEGVDYLGCCSYEHEEDFKRCEYYEDMKDQARDDLYTQIESILARFGCIDPSECATD